MFDSKENCYVTDSLAEKIPVKIRDLCWWAVFDKAEEDGVTMDATQIFELNKDSNRGTIEVTHKQEEPFFNKWYEWELPENYPNEGIITIWVVDDGSKKTMMFPK